MHAPRTGRIHAAAAPSAVGSAATATAALAPSAAALALLAALAPSAAAQVEVIPRVGAEFEHFGETYRITEDRDTVAVINDYGTRIGLTVKTPWTAEDRFRLDTDIHVGKETRRLRLDFDGALRRGTNTFELDQAGTVRFFTSDGGYSVSKNSVEEWARFTWQRRLSDDVKLRLRDTVHLTWYEEPDEFNLNTFLHRPGADLRFALGELSDLRVGYQLGKRSVPDSTELDYWRHTVDVDLSVLFGWTSALDASFQLDRREYDAVSVRESSWEYRGDLQTEFSADERMTFRIIHENEFVRFDTPDELDFDRDWARTGLQVQMHRSRQLDFSVMPVYAFLTSDTAPEEEYAETGLEFGVDWRIGTHTWISLSDEVGRRDYERDAVAVDTSVTDLTDTSGGSGAGNATDTALETGALFSDYLYNRITLLVSSEVAPGVAINLFANWQPEDHRLDTHDSDSRIVSGGVEYRF